ncbi:putative Transcription initiation factor IID, 18kD subunit-domain-containing protein [Seiridium cardinale]|uniref:Transcription initiation factor TFIID subunit 13 n=1 Tax=Seiridium cardinale TaxID=138064 RepID=A0ABR2XYW0_9PEZI
MEPRARAGKNVGKETFPAKDLAALMYAYGDVINPIPETVRVMDEIMTEFLEGICFEASRHATVAGRQKLKFDDFEFSLRRQPEYLGRIRTMFEKRKEITKMRKTFGGDDDAVLQNQGKDDGGAGSSKKRAAADDEELLDDIDDDEDVLEASQSKKRKIG